MGSRPLISPARTSRPPDKLVCSYINRLSCSFQIGPSMWNTGRDVRRPATNRRHFLECNRGKGMDCRPAPHRRRRPGEDRSLRFARKGHGARRQRSRSCGYPSGQRSPPSFSPLESCIRLAHVRRPRYDERDNPRTYAQVHQQRASRHSRRRSGPLSERSAWIPKPRCCCENLRRTS